jgi:arylsulfatase
MVGFAYEGSDPRKPFDEDDWELYHVAEDFSETVDLADQEPERLRDLVGLWWSEAERNQVFPLTNQPGRHGDRRFRRERYEYRPGIGVLPPTLAPNLRNRGYRMTAALDVPAAGADGVIVTHGAHSGGYSLYLQDGRIHWTYNFLGAQITTISSDDALPPGPCTVTLAFTPTGRFQGDIVIARDDAPIAKGHIAQTTPVTYGIIGGFTVGYQRGTSVSPTYKPPFALPAGVLRGVVIEPDGLEHRDPPAEQRAGVAMQ